MEAAWDPVREHRTARVSMHLIANEAPVSRQAIHGLLLAMLRHKDASTRYVVDLSDALTSAPAVDGWRCGSVVGTPTCPRSSMWHPR